MRNKIGEYSVIEELTFDDVMHPDMSLKDELMMMKALGEHQVKIMLKNDRASYVCEICGFDAYPFGDRINMRGIPGFVHWCTECRALFAQGLSPEEIRERLGR